MTQRIKGRGPIIAYDDITPRSSKVIESLSANTKNPENIGNPQISPKTEVSDNSGVSVRWDFDGDMYADGYIAAGVDDPDDWIQFGNNLNKPGFFIKIKPSGFSEALIVKIFEQRERFTRSMTLDVRRHVFAPTGVTKVGYVAPIKIIRSPDLASSVFDFEVLDTSQVETSQSGQVFAGAGSIRRRLRLDSGVVSPQLMFGQPKIGRSIDALSVDPAVDGFTEIPSVTGIGRRWRRMRSGTISLTWPSLLTPGEQYILRTFTISFARPETNFLVGDPATNLPRNFDFAEFTAPASGDFVVSTGDQYDADVEIVSLARLEQPANRVATISGAQAAARNSNPVLVILSPDDPVWTRDTTIFGIPEWQTMTHLETQTDGFRFRLTVTESL